MASRDSNRKVIGDIADLVGDSMRDLPSRRQYLGTLAAGASVGLAGCSGEQDGTTTTDDGSGDSGGDGTTQSGDDGGAPDDADTLILGDVAGLENLDPAMVSAVVSYHVLENTHERLFNITPDLEIETELATDLEISNGGKTWTMPIREGVMFHPPFERELVAEDFIDAFEWISNGDNGSPYTHYFADVTDMVAQDDYTLQLELDKPVTDMKVFLAKQGSEVYPMEAREGDHEIKNHPVGTGAFVFDEWVPESHTRLVKNENYWEEGKPHFDTVEIRPIPKAQTRLTELETGEVEYTEPSLQHIQAVKDNPDLTFDSVPTPAFTEIKVNCSTQWREDNPFADANGGRKARQAVAEAIDYPSVVQGSGFGITTRTQNPFPKSSPWHTDYNPYSWSANPEKAKQLFEESGVGTDITVEMRTNNAYPSHQDAAKIVQENLRQAGVNVNLKLADWATELQIEGDGEFDLAVNGWPAFISPDAFLYSIFHSEGGFNNMGYSNPDLDELLEQGKVEQDTETRKQIYADAQKHIVDDLPYMFLQHWPHQEAYRNNIEGRVNHPYNYLGWNWTDVKEV
jgi:peptide/nickel transport system substrate-binding protein